MSYSPPRLACCPCVALLALRLLRCTSCVAPRAPLDLNLHRTCTAWCEGKSTSRSCHRRTCCFSTNNSIPRGGTDERTRAGGSRWRWKRGRYRGSPSVRMCGSMQRPASKQGLRFGLSRLCYCSPLWCRLVANWSHVWGTYRLIFTRCIARAPIIHADWPSIVGRRVLFSNVWLINIRTPPARPTPHDSLRPDPAYPDLEKFPLFRHASPIKCCVGPGVSSLCYVRLPL